MNTEEKKELIKFNLLREDTLNGSRLSWMLTFQGFLFAAYFVAQPQDNLLPYLGILASLVTISVVLLGAISINNLLNLWHEIEHDKSISPFGLQKQGRWIFLLILGLSAMLPTGCLAAWIYLMN